MRSHPHVAASLVLLTALSMTPASARAQAALPASAGPDDWMEPLSLEQDGSSGWTPPPLEEDMEPFDVDRRGELLHVRSQAEAARVIARSEVVCPTEGDCPAWVGWLLYPSEDWRGNHYVQRCSAFLVGPSQVETAGHCVPDGVRGAFVLFPAQGTHRAERIAVRRIVASESTERNDSALLQLARTARRTPVTIASHTPTVAGTPLWTASAQAFAWDPLRRALRAVIRVQRGAIDLLRNGPCEVRFTGTSVIRGHSGSAVLDEHGRAVGVLVRHGPSPGLGALVPTACWAGRFGG